MQVRSLIFEKLAPKIAGYLLAAAAAGSVCVLAGWQFSIDFFVRIHPRFPIVPPHTAILFFLMSGSIYLHFYPYRSLERFHVSRLAAASVAVISALFLWEYLGGKDLGIDRIFWREELARYAMEFPGRPSKSAALCFLLLGTSVAAKAYRLKLRMLSLLELALIFVFSLSMLSLTSYGFSAALYPQSFRIGSLEAGMPLHSSVFFVFLVVALLLRAPRSAIRELILGDTYGSSFFLKLLPAVILAPLIQGILMKISWDAKEAEIPATLAIASMGNAFFLFFVLWFIATEMGELHWRSEKAALESKCHLAFERSPVGMAMLNLDLGFIKVNEALVKMLGYKEAELLNLSLKEIIHPDDRENALKLFARLANGGISQFESEVRYLGAGGEILTVERSMAMLRDPETGTSYFFGMMKNITDRKKAEESAELWKNVAENVSLGLVLRAPEGKKMEFANSAFAKMHGYAWEEIRESAILDFFAPEVQEAAEREIRIVNEKDYHSFESLHIRKDGSVFPVSVDVAVVKGREGEVRHRMVSVKDISDRKTAEEQFKNLLEAATDAILITDRGGKISFSNSRAEKLFGYSTKELLSLGLNELMPGFPDLSENPAPLASKEFEGVRKDKTLFPAEAGVSVFATNNKFYSITIIRDLSVRKEIERQSAQVQKMRSLGAMAAGLAHDFNSILGLIVGRLSILRREVQDSQDSDLVQHLDAIRRAADMGQSLVRQITAFARQGDIEIREFSFNAMIEDLVQVFRATFPPEIRIQMGLGRDLPLILGDPEKVRQIVLNLCINARQAMKDSGTLTICSGLSAGDELKKHWAGANASSYVWLSIADTGHGMSRSEAEKVFEPFFSTKGGGSTGLGLAAVYGTVQRHEGFVDVSSSPGRGTVFHVYLPVEGPRLS